MTIAARFLTFSLLVAPGAALAQDDLLPESMRPIEIAEEEQVDITAQDGLESRRISLYSEGAIDVSFAMDIQGYASVYSNAGFGSGVTDLFGGQTLPEDGEHVTLFLRPGIIGTYNLEDSGEFYGGLSVVAVGTGGEADYGGFTNGNEAGFALEDYYVGWRSKDGKVDLSVGAQNYQVGSGFIIADGNFDRGNDGAYKTAPRYSFRNTAIGRFKHDGLTVEGFYLRGDEDWDSAETVGINAEYTIDQLGTFGGFYAEVTDADDIFFQRDGMNIWNARYTTPALGPVTISGEYAEETDGVVPRDADAFYVSTTIAPEWQLSPRFIYRYAEHSGDDPTTPVNEGFDPIYYGFTGWQNWFQGDITGSTFLFNSNQETHLVGVGMSPLRNVAVDLHYLNFSLEEPFFRGQATSGADFIDELNLIVQYTPSPNWYVAAVGGVAFPNQAAEDFFGDDETMAVFDLFVAFTF